MLFGMNLTRSLWLGIPALLLQSAYAQTYSYASFDYPNASPSTFFTGINSRGDVAGYAFIAQKGGHQSTQAFVRLANGTFENLPGTTYSSLPEPYGIGDSGTVVGFYDADAVIYTGHTFELFTLGARQTELTGISTNGLMVGNQFGTSVSYAFQLSAGKVQPLPMLYGQPVQANGINSSGTIAGTAPTETGSSVTGFVLAAGGSYQTVAYPGAMYTYFTAINNAGVTAGYWVNGSAAQSFVYSNGDFTEVQFPGSKTTQAFGLNESGAVSGTYTDSGGTQHGFIATPVN